jgi:hypothetical protein
MFVINTFEKTKIQSFTTSISKIHNVIMISINRIEEMSVSKRTLISLTCKNVLLLNLSLFESVRHQPIISPYHNNSRADK